MVHFIKVMPVSLTCRNVSPIKEECRIIIDIGIESNNTWFFYIPTISMTNNKKGEGEARNEVSRDHKHLLSLRLITQFLSNVC